MPAGIEHEILRHARSRATAYVKAIADANRRASLLGEERRITREAATRARRISTLKSLLGFASKIEFTASNLGTVLRVPKIAGRLHEHLLDEAEVNQMINEAASARHGILLRLLYLSGLRISEAVGIRWIDLGPCGMSVIGKGWRATTVGGPEGAACRASEPSSSA